MNLLLKFCPDDLLGKKLYRFYEYVGTAFIIGESTTETAVSRAYVPFSVKNYGTQPVTGSLQIITKPPVFRPVTEGGIVEADE